MSQPHSDSNPFPIDGIEEFLYMEPDTGMIVCMIADGDGFRPATASQEMEKLPVHWTGNTWSPDAVNHQHFTSGDVSDEDSSIDSFVKNFEHAFLAPCAG